MENKSVRCLIIDVTGSNGGLMWELNRAGVLSGDVVNGLYSEANKSVSFTFGGVDCVAWVGETCVVLDQKLCSVGDKSCPYHSCTTNHCMEEAVMAQGISLGDCRCK